jgi:ArsR family transcriptional regulator
MNNSAIYAGGERFDRFFKALGDPHRIKILALLRERELSAGEILEAIDIVQSTLSHHMKTLTDAEAVIAVRRGKWTYYSLNGAMLEEASAFLKIYAEGTKEKRQETEVRRGDPGLRE